MRALLATYLVTGLSNGQRPLDVAPIAGADPIPVEVKHLHFL
jgi:hypothetical protein